MADANSQGNGNGSGDGGAGDGGAGNGGGTPPAVNPQGGAGDGGASDQFDPTKLTPEQLNQVLEKNPLIWKTDRLTELRDKSKKFDDAEAARTAAENKALEDQGKFKELSEKQAAENAALKQQLQDNQVSSALTGKLIPLGVIDLEGALKLIDRSKVTVGDDGAITGLDEAVEALKTGKAYLFNAEGGSSANKNVGTPSNPGNGGGTGGGATFKRSQLQDSTFYQANREAILKAQAEGKIEDDIS